MVRLEKHHQISPQDAPRPLTACPRLAPLLGRPAPLTALVGHGVSLSAVNSSAKDLAPSHGPLAVVRLEINGEFHRRHLPALRAGVPPGWVA